MDPELLGQDQLAASDSEMASDSLPPPGAGVGEKRSLSQQHLELASSLCLAFFFLALTNQRKKEPSPLLKTSWIFPKGTHSSWAGCVKLE